MREPREAWTIEQEQILTELWKDTTMTGQDIARKLNMSRSAVLGKVRRMKLPYREEAIAHKKNSKNVNSEPVRIRKKRQMRYNHTEPVIEDTPITVDPATLKKMVDLHITKECHYPMIGSSLFCAKPTTGNSVYCPHHERLCRGSYTPKQLTPEQKEAKERLWRAMFKN